MIQMDSSTKAEVPIDTVLYAASAKIVDTVKADHEHLGHIPLLQLKKMIQNNLISPHGSSEKAHLLSTYNQIKAAISRGFFCPTCAIIKNSVVPQPLESTRRRLFRETYLHGYIWSICANRPNSARHGSLVPRSRN